MLATFANLPCPLNSETIGVTAIRALIGVPIIKRDRLRAYHNYLTLICAETRSCRYAWVSVRPVLMSDRMVVFEISRATTQTGRPVKAKSEFQEQRLAKIRADSKQNKKNKKSAANFDEAGDRVPPV